MVYCRLLGSWVGVEEAQANPVVAVILEDLKSGHGPVVVLEDGAAIFGLLEKRKVGADGVIGRVQSSRGREEGVRIRVSWPADWHERVLSSAARP